MNRTSVKRLLLMQCLMGFALAAPMASADIFFEQLPIDAFDAEQPGIGPDLSDGVTDGRYLSGPIVVDDELQMVERADDFNVSGRRVVRFIEWWGSYSSSTDADSFTISIFSSLKNVNGATESTLVFSETGLPLGDGLVERTLDGKVDYDNPPDPLLEQDQYRYLYFLPDDVILSEGTYYLSIINDLGQESDWYWSWGEPGNLVSWSRLGDDPIGLSDGTKNWNLHRDSIDLAFRLGDEALASIGIVPEPASMSLLALGLAGFALRQYRRRD